MTVMDQQPIRSIMLVIAACFVGLVYAAIETDFCWGSNSESATPAITLDVRNEPLRSVLGKISKTTRWKINAPEKWMEKPVSQALNKVTLEEGLQSVLRNAGVENILLMYDENIRAVTLFDTEVTQQQRQTLAERRQAQVSPQPPAVSPADDESAPVIKRSARVATPGNSPGSRRARRQASQEDD